MEKFVCIKTLFKTNTEIPVFEIDNVYEGEMRTISKL